MQELLPGQSHTITVNARNKWNPSGIYLKPSFTYNFKVINHEKWKDAHLDATPEIGHLSSPSYLKLFSFLKRFSKANWYVLVGSIGKDKKTFFKIGEQLGHYTPQTSGEFYCFANDAEGFYGNNQGKLTLKISCLGQEKIE